VAPARGSTLASHTTFSSPLSTYPTVDFWHMREISDGFLLNMAEVSATLIGLFL
jgi:hypothetical protein